MKTAALHNRNSIPVAQREMASLIRIVGRLTLAVTALEQRVAALEQRQQDESPWMTEELLTGARIPK